MKSIYTLALAGLTTGLSVAAMPPAPVQSAPKVTVKTKNPGKGKVKEVVATGYIAAPPAKVWKAVTSYGAYPKFMPRVISSRVSSRKGHLAIATMKLNLPFPFQGTWYTNRYTENAKTMTVSWKMIDGSLKDNRGSWSLRPKGRGTLGTYRVQTDLGSVLLPAWMINTVTKQTIPKIFARVETYANKL